MSLRHGGDLLAVGIRVNGARQRRIVVICRPSLLIQNAGDGNQFFNVRQAHGQRGGDGRASRIADQRHVGRFRFIDVVLRGVLHGGHDFGRIARIRPIRHVAFVLRPDVLARARQINDVRRIVLLRQFQQHLPAGSGVGRRQIRRAPRVSVPLDVDVQRLSLLRFPFPRREFEIIGFQAAKFHVVGMRKRRTARQKKKSAYKDFLHLFLLRSS